jgi:hypothetical protein
MVGTIKKEVLTIAIKIVLVFINRCKGRHQISSPTLSHVVSITIEEPHTIAIGTDTSLPSFPRPENSSRERIVFLLSSYLLKFPSED